MIETKCVCHNTFDKSGIILSNKSKIVVKGYN